MLKVFTALYYGDQKHQIIGRTIGGTGRGITTTGQIGRGLIGGVDFLGGVRLEP